MKVKELIELLSIQDPEAEVILQGDDEGNSHHNARRVYSDLAKFIGYGEWDFMSSLDEEDIEEAESDPLYRKVVVIYP